MLILSMTYVLCFLSKSKWIFKWRTKSRKKWVRLCFFSDTAFNTRGLPCIDGHQLPLWIDKGAPSKHPVFYLDRGTFIVYAKWCGLVDGVLKIFFFKERHCRKIIDFFFQIKKRENVKNIYIFVLSQFKCTAKETSLST